MKEILESGQKLDSEDLYTFRCNLNEFQRDLAVILLLDRLTSEGKTAVQIYNMLAKEEEQFFGVLNEKTGGNSCTV